MKLSNTDFKIIVFNMFQELKDKMETSVKNLEAIMNKRRNLKLKNINLY